MKKILIMGATSGIGLALARTLLSRGVRIGAAGRNAEALKRLSDEYPGMVETQVIDITQSSALKELAILIEKLGGLDLYIHTAGIAMRNQSLAVEDEIKVVETNAVGFARMTSAVFNYFKKREIPGQIVAVSSVAATRGIGELAAYSASKSFDSKYLEALQQLAHQYKMKLSITDIRPGWTRTPLVDPDKHYILEMELDKVVPEILRAIVRKRQVAIIDWRWRLLCAGWRLVPRCIWVRMSGFGL